VGKQSVPDLEQFSYTFSHHRIMVTRHWEFDGIEQDYGVIQHDVIKTWDRIQLLGLWVLGVRKHRNWNSRICLW